MPLGKKFRTLRDLKRRPDGKEYPLGEIASLASGLYREEKILRRTQELQAAGASMDEIERECEVIRQEADAVNRLYLTDLHQGKKSDVTWRVVQALSLFFEVPTDFWRIGPDATDATRRAEEEVELIALGVEAARAIQNLDSGVTESDQKDTEGMALMGALFRGVGEADSEQARAILRLALQGLKGAQQDPSG